MANGVDPPRVLAVDWLETAFSSIGPFSIEPGDTVLRHTLDGDTNLDGAVNLVDFNGLAGSFGQSNRAWANGDSSYDGVVNLADFNALAGTFGQGIVAIVGGDEPHPGEPLDEDIPNGW